jgi:iron complex transport system permease protein
VTAALEAARLHRRLGRRRALWCLGLAAGCGLLLALDVATGPARLPLAQVVRALAGAPADATVQAIVFSIRLPMALLALAVGAALGLSGAVMQTALNNPLASSYTLGVSAGAGFGAALAIVLGAWLPLPEAVAVPLSAFLFSGIACGGVLLVGSLRGAMPETLVLAGIALLFLFQALLSLLQYLASPEALPQIVFWLFGSLLKATPLKALLVGLVLLAVLPLLLRDAWELTALRLGDARARALGVRTGALRLRALAAVSLLTGAAVAFTGTIGFVGLIAPHVARVLVGEDQRYLLPASALAGALLLSAASVASKTLVPGAVFPIGIVTALVGVPCFAAIVLRSRRSFW